jgi:hypothetical protein
MHVRRWCASHASCCGGAWGSRSLARVDWLTAASLLCFLSSLRAEAVTCREDGVSGTQRLSAGILVLDFINYKYIICRMQTTTSEWRSGSVVGP